MGAPQDDPRRRGRIIVAFKGEGSKVGSIFVDGVTWGAVEWSERRGVWCIEDAEGRCLSHTASIHGEAAAKDEAIALAERMVRDGTLPAPEEAAELHREAKQRERETKQREREKRAKRPSEIRRKQEREERNRLLDADFKARWENQRATPFYQILDEAFDLADPEAMPVPLWIFGNSLSDFFDNHPDVAPWREEAWTKVIHPTTSLRWLLLTKRIPNVLKMLPADWDGGRNYRHVCIIASIGDQAEFDRDVPRLVALKAHGVRCVGLSIERQLGPVSIIGCPEARQLDWIINGGESTQLFPARKYLIEWARQLINESRALNIPFFLKQLGSLPFGARRIYTKHSAGADPAEWPADLRVQQWPRVYESEERTISQPTLI